MAESTILNHKMRGINGTDTTNDDLMSEQQNQSSAQTDVAASQPQTQKYHLKYESLTAVFADHVVLNSTNGGLIFDFASCAVNDPTSGHATLPIHTRVAMTNHGAKQLYQLLRGVFEPKGAQTQDGGGAAPPAGE